MTALRIGSALLLVAVVPTFAHHSFAVFFDADKSVTVRGVVQEFQFRNPHGLLKVLVKSESGEEAWKAETNSPSILERRGWTRESIKVGEIISIEGWPARDGSRYLRVRAVRRADGTPVGTAANPAETVGEQK
jgi:hypothetical protein